MLNGLLTHLFTSTKGIRQGDPFSLYIFILFMETLSCHDKQWTPIQLSRRGPPISHLFFTDDITLTSRVTTTSIHTIIDILNQFTHNPG